MLTKSSWYCFVIFGPVESNEMKMCMSENSLDSAGDGGFIVSGLTQSDGDGERSRFVVMWPNPSANPVE